MRRWALRLSGERSAQRQGPSASELFSLLACRPWFYGVQLAKALGMPELRELVLARHVVLYAHSERDVLLLSLRHERQFGYRLSM
jgi:hypothetical protein